MPCWSRLVSDGLEPTDPHVHDLRIGTLHSLCDALLAEFDDAYMAAGTQVIDETETRVRMARTHRWTLGFVGQQPGRTVNRLLASESAGCPVPAAMG